MKTIRFALIILLSIFINNVSLAKEPSSLIIEIVDEAASILSSSNYLELTKYFPNNTEILIN